MLSTASLSEDGTYRYQLTRTWNSNSASVVWIMLNPSTADALKDDATIRRCIGFSLNWGFGGIEVYNLFALRSSSPINLVSAEDPIGPENDKWLSEIPLTRTIHVAWGCIPKSLILGAKREKEVLLMLGKWQNLYCLGTTAQGYPRHPVRLPYSTNVEVYDIRPQAKGAVAAK